MIWREGRGNCQSTISTYGLVASITRREGMRWDFTYKATPAPRRALLCHHKKVYITIKRNVLILHPLQRGCPQSKSYDFYDKDNAVNYAWSRFPPFITRYLGPMVWSEFCWRRGSSSVSVDYHMKDYYVHWVRIPCALQWDLITTLNVFSGGLDLDPNISGQAWNIFSLWLYCNLWLFMLPYPLTNNSLGNSTISK